MRDAYLVRISVEGLENDQREILSALIVRLASRFSFRGLEDWTIDLASSTKILGVEREFHDLRGKGRTSDELVVYFGKGADAKLFGDILRKSFADLPVSAPRKQARRDWMKAWRRHYKPVTIREGKTALVITPAWKAAPKRVPAVRIYPGQAFGTGTHPTTRLCLRLFLRHRDPGLKSILDFGAGTGILALGAQAIAGKNVKALLVESDPEGLAQAKKNARINRAKVSFSRKVKKGRYDLVFANVLAPVLLAQKAQLDSALKPGGLIILSGILKNEGAKFLDEFRTPGMALAEELSEGDWVAFALRKQ
jgi:ribosomal protein L11 methyltransferase